MTTQLAHIASDNDSHDAWAERGDYWFQKLNPVPQYKAKRRHSVHKPLILSGHGVRLKVDRGTLLIQSGFTHYPQKREEHRFFPQDRQLPSRIVVLDGDGAITFDALEWLSTQNVPLVQINWRGEVVSIGGNMGYAADAELAQTQREIRNSSKGFEFSKALILEKIENSRMVIEKVSKNSPEIESVLKQLDVQAAVLKKNPPVNITALLAIEGIAAGYYFRHLQTIPLKWKGTGRKPIPEDWLQIRPRIASGGHNQFARHPINAILNYVYGVLENQVRTQLLMAGVDPTIGYIHALGENRHSLVFDFMEPLRPIMDCRIIEFIQRHVFLPDDFILNKNGICRLQPQFARYIVKLVQDMLEIEVITSANLKKLFASQITPKKKIKVSNSANLQLIK